MSLQSSARSLTERVFNPSLAPGFVSRVDTAGTRTVLNVGGPSIDPHDVAMDSLGNFVITDELDARLVTIPSAGGPPAQLGANFADSQPLGITTDGAGNYIVCTFAFSGGFFGKLLRVPSTGPPGVVVFDYSTVSSPSNLVASYVTLDANGDYIVAENVVTSTSNSPPGFLSRITPSGVRTVIATIDTSLISKFIRDPSTGSFVLPEPQNGLISEVTPAGVRSSLFTFTTGAAGALIR